MFRIELLKTIKSLKIPRELKTQMSNRVGNICAFLDNLKKSLQKCIDVYR